MTFFFWYQKVTMYSMQIFKDEDFSGSGNGFHDEPERQLVRALNIVDFSFYIFNAVLCVHFVSMYGVHSFFELAAYF